MAIVLKYVDDFHTYMNTYADARTTNWFLMSSPFYTLGICLSYAYTAKVLGPKLMENRKPLQLKNELIAYNLFQVIFSAWILYQGMMGGWWGEYNFICQPVDYSDSPSGIRMAHTCWWYYMSKLTELMDTVFFILRKKNNQITTLHVIHHGIMPMSVWFGVKFLPGGNSTLFGLLNLKIHIIMYSYYLLAALGPQMQKYLWWKKYLTTLQILQFVLIIVHAFVSSLTNCNYPPGFLWFIGMHALMFFFLFRNFYKQTYTKKNKGTTINGPEQHVEEQNVFYKQNGLQEASDYYTNTQFTELNNRTKVE